MIFKVLPDVKVGWRDVWLGGFLTAALFEGGKTALGLYLGKSSAVSAYGAAGSLVLLLLWVYYSAQILFFGAELTKVYATRYGRCPEPKENAEWGSPPKRATAGATAAESEPRAKSRPEPGRKDQLLAELREEIAELREVVGR
jgi:membrane protein